MIGNIDGNYFSTSLSCYALIMFTKSFLPGYGKIESLQKRLYAGYLKEKRMTVFKPTTKIPAIAGINH